MPYDELPHKKEISFGSRLLEIIARYDKSLRDEEDSYSGKDLVEDIRTSVEASFDDERTLARFDRILKDYQGDISYDEVLSLLRKI